MFVMTTIMNKYLFTKYMMVAPVNRPHHISSTSLPRVRAPSNAMNASRICKNQTTAKCEGEPVLLTNSCDDDIAFSSPFIKLDD